MPGSTDSTAEHGFREFVHARTPALSRTAYLLTGDAIVRADPDDKGAYDSDLYRVGFAPDGTTSAERIASLEEGQPATDLTVATDLPVQEFDDPEWASNRGGGLTRRC